MNPRARSIIRATLGRATLAAVVCLAVVLFAFVAEGSRSDALGEAQLARIEAKSALHKAHLPSFAVAASNGAKQLIGLGGSTPASQEANGLWGYHIQPN